jgi:hypothetical protein
VIADAQTTAPTQAEIDREVAEIESSMKQRINPLRRSNRGCRSPTIWSRQSTSTRP